MNPPVRLLRLLVYIHELLCPHPARALAFCFSVGFVDATLPLASTWENKKCVEAEKSTACIAHHLLTRQKEVVGVQAVFLRPPSHQFIAFTILKGHPPSAQA